ncbi:MAG: phage integrase N-terminal SAM-like domain-containing protein [Desulfobulbaceae bacterium]|nr:phage integrase N-terminal SAM-like domain-containing protein [Desulfobulbaceae bacterium]
MGNYCDYGVDNLTSDELLDYFSQLIDSYSWGTVKLHLYGLKLFYTHVLKKTLSFQHVGMGSSFGYIPMGKCWSLILKTHYCSLVCSR